MKRFTLILRAIVAASICAKPHVQANSATTQASPSSAASFQSAAPLESQTPPPFQMKVESNLVVVRVVVRDSQGVPIKNLTKDSFRLFDNGHEQKISQFSIESPATAAVAVSQPGAPEIKSATPVAAPVARNVAFYFDDLTMALDEINNARDAADRFLAKNLRPPDRAAIFTSSGHVHTIFTSDLKALHDAMVRVIPVPNVRECPQISDYQAERIIDYEDTDAVRLAISDARMRCHVDENGGPAMSQSSSSSGLGGGQSLSPAGSPSGSRSGGASTTKGGPSLSSSLPSQNPSATGPGMQNAPPFIKQQAEFILLQSRQRSERSIGMLNAIVLGMAHMYGQKEIILTSPGFIPRNLEDEVNHVIDRALAAQIVISSLDPKGVALLMPETDVTSNYDPKMASLWNSFAGSRELYATAVLSQIAQETGGDFFHHNNDLDAGFARLAIEPTSYMLAFSPATLDGKFHKLQVKLVDTTGTLQARRGYFAIKPERDLDQQQAETPEKKDELSLVMSSREEFHDLAVDVSTQIGPSSGDLKQLAVLVKLDLNSVHFRKDGDNNNVDSLVFVAGIYDGEGKWVTGQQKHFDLKVPDAQLQDMRAKGVGVRTMFELKPGTYLLREVVQDSEEHHLGVINRSVQVQ